MMKETTTYETGKELCMSRRATGIYGFGKEEVEEIYCTLTILYAAEKKVVPLVAAQVALNHLFSKYNDDQIYSLCCDEFEGSNAGDFVRLRNCYKNKQELEEKLKMLVTKYNDYEEDEDEYAFESFMDFTAPSTALL